MPFTDLPLADLREFRPDVAQPADFDEFWTTTLAEARAVGGETVLTPADTPINQLVIEDLTFPGFNGEPIRAWVTRPRTDTPLPAVVEYIGYNGGRGLPGERLQWAAAGYVHVFMDTRGQGSGSGSGGDTPDPYGSEGSVAGWMTRGISNPGTYFYRRVFTDGVRLVDAVKQLPFVDASRISVTGGSQGGGITLAVAALSQDVFAAMPDVPFLSHFQRSVELTPQLPFTEITHYLSVHRDQDDVVFNTLSYFDGVNFARRIEVPSLFSVALMDPIVLPSTVFAAYNHLASQDKDITVWKYNGHEGGQLHQWLRQTQWLAERL
ncbi:cephalosporin-C deacetylase [Tessaracoccus terricola]